MNRTHNDYVYDEHGNWTSGSLRPGGRRIAISRSNVAPRNSYYARGSAYGFSSAGFRERNTASITPCWRWVFRVAGTSPSPRMALEKASLAGYIDRKSECFGGHAGPIRRAVIDEMCVGGPAGVEGNLDLILPCSRLHRCRHQLVLQVNWRSLGNSRIAKLTDRFVIGIALDQAHHAWVLRRK